MTIAAASTVIGALALGALIARLMESDATQSSRLAVDRGVRRDGTPAVRRYQQQQHRSRPTQATPEVPMDAVMQQAAGIVAAGTAKNQQQAAAKVKEGQVDGDGGALPPPPAGSSAMVDVRPAAAVVARDVPQAPPASTTTTTASTTTTTASTTTKYAGATGGGDPNITAPLDQEQQQAVVDGEWADGGGPAGAFLGDAARNAEDAEALASLAGGEESSVWKPRPPGVAEEDRDGKKPSGRLGRVAPGGVEEKQPQREPGEDARQWWDGASGL